MFAQSGMVPEDIDRDFSQALSLHDPTAQYLVVSGDTLWNISKRIKPKSLSIWQTMDGVFSANTSVFLDGDPSKVIIGSTIDIPTRPSIEDQSGMLIAQILNLEIYKKRDYRIAQNPGRVFEDSANLHIAKFGDDQKIPYFQVRDLDLPSKPTESLESSVDQDLMNSADNEILIKSNEMELIRTIDMLSAEIEMLEGMVVSEVEETARALSEVKRARVENKKQSWIEFVESKVVLALLLLSILYVLFVLRRKPNQKQRVVSDEIESIDEDLFADNNRSVASVFDNESEDPTDAEGFEFTDDFNPELSENLDYLDSSENINPVDVKLDLAETYADLGDLAGAREILQEIISESSKEGKARATEVLEKLNTDFPDQ
jgi:FimV-like protein